MNKVFKGDSIRLMEKMEEGSVDLIVTSPPYNLDIQYDSYSDLLPIEEYAQFVESFAASAYRVLKRGGRICVNVPPDIGRLKDGTKIPLDVLYTNALEEGGLSYRAKVVWHKKQITTRTAWGSWMSPSNPNLLPSFEYILVAHKQVPKHTGKGKDIKRQEFIDWTDALWYFPPETSSDHPAPFPEELLKRCILMYSYQNDVVLDPFCGEGTTCAVAKGLGRRYIGIDLSERYVRKAKSRISSVQWKEEVNKREEESGDN